MEVTGTDDLSDKTVCFIDNGIFHSFARKIAPAFGKAFYYTPWEDSFPKSNRTKLGAGFPELERVKYPLKHADDVDLWVFTDTFHGGLQTFLVDYGARVFGARMGEEIELFGEKPVKIRDRSAGRIDPVAVSHGTAGAGRRAPHRFKSAGSDWTKWRRANTFKNCATKNSSDSALKMENSTYEI